MSARYRSPLAQWPLCLWASSLSLTHPNTGELMRFEAEQPPWLKEVTQGELAAWQQQQRSSKQPMQVGIR